MSPVLHARILAAKRRLMLRFGGGFDPHPPPPSGIDLSPSATHFADYKAAPLALSWSKKKTANAMAWQTKARAKLAALTGYKRYPNLPKLVHKEGTALDPKYDRRRYYLRVRDNSHVPVTILRPQSLADRLPIMICLQGTNSGAHLSWGEARMPADPLKIAAGGDYARQAVAHGYAAICIEQTAFGQRREQRLHRKSTDPCIDAANHALLLGRTLLGERVTDLSAVVDWLIAEAKTLGLDAKQPTVMGSSSGGSTAVFAAALDPRLAAVMVCGCVGFIRETIAKRGDASGQNTIPGILNWLEYDDVLALIAPRPLLVIAGDKDHIWPYDGASAVVDSARCVYDAFGAGKSIRAVVAAGGHRFYPNVAWRQFANLLNGD